MVPTVALPFDTLTSGMAPVARMPPPLEEVTPLAGMVAWGVLPEQPAKAASPKSAAPSKTGRLCRIPFWKPDFMM